VAKLEVERRSVRDDHAGGRHGGQPVAPPDGLAGRDPVHPWDDKRHLRTRRQMTPSRAERTENRVPARLHDAIGDHRPWVSGRPSWRTASRCCRLRAQRRSIHAVRLHDSQETVPLYRSIAKGGPFRSDPERRVLTTRNDGRIGFAFTGQGWNAY
jgi:hypothetical protein